MNKLLIVVVFNCFCLTSYASTFVDNGGTIYEAELRVALKQTKSAVREIEYYKQNELAKCSESQQGKFCQYLDGLSKKERRIVQQLLSKHYNAMRKRIKSVKITLTGESIKHARAHGPWRKVQAGANPKSNSIIINQEDFVSLSPAERVMLLVHELGHLIKINGRYIRDDDKLDGMRGRELLDAMGASVALLGMDTSIVPLKSESLESKAYKDHWFTLQAGTLGLDEQSKDNSLVASKLQYSSFSYRLQFMSFGFNLAYDGARQTDYSSGYSVDIDITRYKLGAS
ncbi:MAG: hypothetical protein AB8G05_19375 [Oligoflexales bacterium]